jgi:hypothetical protein
MLAELVTALRRSPIVTFVEVTEWIEEESVEFLRARADIVDGSLLYVRELVSPDYSKYSYHWQDSSGQTRLRWDNAPHHRQLATHPDHGHDGTLVVASPRVSVEEVLAEIAARLEHGSLS